MDLKIRPPKTNKNKILTRPLMRDGIIPKHPASIIFNGRSGSGKTVLLSNLLDRDIFYKDYFDEIYLFSGSPDDIFDTLNIKKKNIFNDWKEWETKLEKICSTQEKLIKNKGIHKAPRVLLLFEDIINYSRFMRTSKYFTRCFIANRHFNVSTWITTQSWTKIPRVCRINTNCIYYFKGTEGEKDLLAEEYSPSGFTKREFGHLIDHATKDDYSFLTINLRLKESIRFRKNLDIILEI